MTGKCEVYLGLQNPKDLKKCCAKECNAYCGATNCQDEGDGCCDRTIDLGICGINGKTAPCTLGMTLICSP